MRTRIQGILKRTAAVLLVFILTLNMVGSFLEYSLAAGGSLSSIGTNKALGSPILNESFSVDDWNKWEMVVWGIFLSNFMTPFVDDYNSAFNLDSGYGSKGSGAKALQFGSGRDPANSKVIQNLLDYAINQQSTGAIKQIYVSYNTVEGAEITKKADFSSNNTGTTDSTTDGSTSEDTVNQDETVNQDVTELVRAATLRDLLFMDKKEEGTTWARSSADPKNIFASETILYTDNYVDMVGIKDGNIPTFAIRTTSGTHQVVLDYTKSYDLSLIQTAITKALTGDYKKEFISMITDIASKDAANYPLVLDCFGNICIQDSGKYRVIIPAAANPYLTTNPSINLVNSLIFNASTNTMGKLQVINNGGQDNGGLLSHLHKEFWQSGLPAFSNGFDGTMAGQTILFYDTDTIVYADATKDKKVDDYSSTSQYEVNTGDLYKKLFDLDINDAVSQPYAFKIEPANMNLIDFGTLDGDAKTLVYHTLSRANQLVNLFNTEPNMKVLTTFESITGEVPLFDDPVVVSVQMDPGMKVGGMSISDHWQNLWNDEDKKFNLLAIYRHFVNYTYEAYMGDADSVAGDVSSSKVREAFDNASTPNELFTNLLTEVEGGTVTKLFQSFILKRTDFYEVNDLNKLKTLAYSAPNSLEDIWMASGEATMLNGENLTSDAFSLRQQVSKSHGSVDDADTEGYGRSPFGRSIKIYTTSEVMRAVANVLGVREGTDFATFSSEIYMTYLKWYGITGSSMSQLAGNENTSLLNAAIFDGNSDILKVDITTLTESMTDEQKENQIRDWTYLMLSPSEGREYRSNMIISGISDWIYDNYQKIVYGNSSSYYDTGSGVTSRNSTGFLAISPYSENFMTAWLIDNYSYFVSILIGAFIILIVVIGVLNKRKISWYMIAIFSMINMLLVLPSTGEIAPLVSNNFVQNMFSDKMSYWAISEGVTNATMEMDYVTGNTISNSYLGSLSKKEQEQVVNLVKNLNVLYTDRSLNIKQDISKKVTATDISLYEEAQQLRSARWMLPMIMRQFTANDGSANYVFVPLADKYEDLGNWYWFYNPEEAASAKTINSTQVSTTTEPIPDGKDSILYNNSTRSNAFGAYTDLHDYAETDGYWNISYSKGGTNVHTFNYMIPETLLIGYQIPSHDKGMSYDDWAEQVASNAKTQLDGSSIDSVERVMELYGGEYNRFKRSTINEIYGFMWATENPLHYFYAGIKDSFDITLSAGGIAGELTGSYKKLDDETEVRKSFMHSGETGHIRDIVDLEGMFKNMIPYLYAMQLGTAGYGDIEGYFADDDMIQEYEIYKGNNKAWLFRSNWVTKIMENKTYHGDYVIGLSDGTEATVTNMLLPDAYTAAGRDMVFSEAQMYEQGLTEQDLSLVELKCVKINKDISRQWTLLVNYVSVPGMTREVLIRQMALDALLVFNEEFSPVGLTSAAFQMYPSGIDLRSISFDSVMKMLMLNITHDTSYIYGDTMQTIVEDSDIFTAILLLATAFICAFIIPLARNVLMGLIFFLGLWAIIWSIFRTTKTKLKVSCGYIVSNFVFLGLTLLYYAGFSALMAMTTTDEVLSLSQIEVNTGNPVWCLIFVLILSILYCVGIYKIAQLCVRNYRDMGFEVYAGIAEMTVGNISKKMEGLGSKLSKAFTGQSAAEAVESSIGGKRTRGSGGKSDPVDVRNMGSDDSGSGSSGSRSGSGSGGSGSDGSGKRGNKSATDVNRQDDYERSSYTDGRSEIDDSRGSYEIDDKIKKGKQMQIENDKKEAEKKQDKNRSMDEPRSGYTPVNDDSTGDEYYQTRSHSSTRGLGGLGKTETPKHSSTETRQQDTNNTETKINRTESNKPRQEPKIRDSSRSMGSSIDNRQNPRQSRDD